MILGASFDAPEKNCAFADKFSYPFRLVTFDRALGAVWDAIDPADPDWPRRISYLIDPAGRIARVYETVSPASHAAQVLADV